MTLNIPLGKYAEPQWWPGNYSANAVFNIIRTGEGSVQRLEALADDADFDANLIGPYGMTALRAALIEGDVDQVGAVLLLGVQVGDADVQYAQERQRPESVIAALRSADLLANISAIV